MPPPASTARRSTAVSLVEKRSATGTSTDRPACVKRNWVALTKACDRHWCAARACGVFGNLHVWTADTQKPSERQAWLAQLDEMQALEPELVVPGHMAAGTRLDDSAIRHTRDYLQRFEAELPKAKDAAELIGVMKTAYPQAGLGVALDIGAKVNKGEMKW